MQETKFNHIEVIQWLRAGDRATGTELLDKAMRDSRYTDSVFTFQETELSCRTCFNILSRYDNMQTCPD